MPLSAERLSEIRQRVQAIGQGRLPIVTRKEDHDVLLELVAEGARCRALLARCHEALGEDPDSDDETLPEMIRQTVLALHAAVAEATALRAEEARQAERAARIAALCEFCRDGDVPVRHALHWEHVWQDTTTHTQTRSHSAAGRVPQ